MRTVLSQFARFALVGGLATAFQYLALVVLVHTGALGPVAASGVGFAGSAVLNYWLNHRYTFRSRQLHATAVPRFAAVAGCGLLINQAVIGAAVDLAGAHYLVAQVAATSCVMAWNFILGRIWTFGGNERIGHGS